MAAAAGASPYESIFRGYTRVDDLVPGIGYIWVDNLMPASI